MQGESADQRPSRGGPNIFDDPLVSELPSFEDGLPGRPSNKRVHSFAQTLEGDTFVAQGGAPKARKEYSAWTPVKGFNLSYLNKESISFTIAVDPYYGNLSLTRAQVSGPKEKSSVYSKASESTESSGP